MKVENTIYKSKQENMNRCIIWLSTEHELRMDTISIRVSSKAVIFGNKKLKCKTLVWLYAWGTDLTILHQAKV